MGLLDRFKNKGQGKEQETMSNVIAAPVGGTVVAMEDIPDPVFSSGALGRCYGIEPEEGRIIAPIAGEIVQLSDTLHAVGIQGTNGVEMLIHVGVDTVEMNGDGFEAFVCVGDQIQPGQKLLTMDLEKIKAAGHPTTVILLVTNSTDFSEVRLEARGEVAAMEKLLSFHK